MKAAVGHPDSKDATWAPFAILGAQLGLLPVFVALVIDRLAF